MAIYANSQHKGSLRALHIYTISPVVLIKHCSDFFRADFLAIYINSKKKIIIIYINPTMKLYGLSLSTWTLGGSLPDEHRELPPSSYFSG